MPTGGRFRCRPWGRYECRGGVANLAGLERDVSLEGWVGPGFFKSFKFAAIILTIWPIIVVYPFIQKYFVKGVLVGSVKD